MPQFKKKPVVIEARQFTSSNADSITEWCGGTLVRSCASHSFLVGGVPPYIEVPSLEGLVRANIGDWIIRGVRGEFYVIRRDIFEETYEAA